MLVNRSFLVLGLFLIAACSSPSPAPDTVASLEGTSWTVVSIEETAVILDTVVTAQFGADGKMSGNAGCNRYFTSYDTEGSMIHLGLAGATKMYCNEPNGVMDQESRFLEALGLVASFESSGNQLEFVNGDGEITLRFQADMNDK